MTDEPLSGLAEMLAEHKAQRVKDAAAYRAHDANVCMMCLVEGADKRSLRISCGYDVKEVVPETLNLGEISEETRGVHYANLCKNCRGMLLDHLGQWRNECVAKRGQPMDHDGHLENTNPAADIPVRSNGRIIYLTQEQWDERRPDREPYRLKK